MRIAESDSAELRHRIGLDPADVIEDPVAEILKDCAYPEDVVIGADDPDGPGVLQQTAAGMKPGAGELVVGVETQELVPTVIHRVHAGDVGTVKLVAKLEVIGRVGKNE